MPRQTIVPNFSAEEVREFMATQWTRYYSDSHSGLRLGFNGLGEIRVRRRPDVSRDAETIWQGTDIREARLALLQAAGVES